MSKSSFYLFCLPLLLAASILFGCAHPPDSSTYTKDGKVYGEVRGAFRYKWWNYYERGLSFADGRFFEEAVRDFNSAITKRENDQRMARTYGMHFIDYFPHRELGIVYYQMGNLEGAKNELSLSQPVSHVKDPVLPGSSQKRPDGKERGRSCASKSHNRFFKG